MPPRAKPTRTTPTTAASPKPDLQNEQAPGTVGTQLGTLDTQLTETVDTHSAGTVDTHSTAGTVDTHSTKSKTPTAKAVTSKKIVTKKAVTQTEDTQTEDTHPSETVDETVDTHSKAAPLTSESAATAGVSKKANPKKAANVQTEGTVDTHSSESKTQTTKAVTPKKTVTKKAGTAKGTVDTHPSESKIQTAKAVTSKKTKTAANAETVGTTKTVDTHKTKTNNTKQAKSLRLSKAERQRLDWICQQLLATDLVDPRSALLGKHENMASNPFRFMRGSAGLFYADLQQGVIQLPASIAQWPLTMVQGDCHLSNLGLFTEEGSSGDLVKFGPNDFDDACIGRAGWDLLRLSLSFILTVRYCRAVQQGELDDAETRDALPKQALADDNDIRSALLQLQQSYRRTSLKIVEDPEVRYHAITDFDKDHVLKPLLKKAIARSLKGDKFWSHSSLAKLVDLQQQPLRFKTRPGKLQALSAEQIATLREVFAPYAGDYIHDIVMRQGAGTGSLNMQRYYLLVGPEQIDSKADLTLCYLVEVKQQRSAAPLAFFSELSPMNRLSPAHLTVDCQRQMLRRPDLVLDELQWDGHHYLVRSLHHANVDIEPADVVSANALWQYADACGHAMALVHNRGDRRSIRFAQAVAATPEQDWQQLITNIWQYAVQQQRDCALLQQQLQQTRGRGVV